MDSSECSDDASGLSEVTGVVVSPDGDDVYTSGSRTTAERLDRRVLRGDGGALYADRLHRDARRRRRRVVRQRGDRTGRHHRTGRQPGRRQRVHRLGDRRAARSRSSPAAPEARYPAPPPNDCIGAEQGPSSGAGRHGNRDRKRLRARDEPGRRGRIRSRPPTYRLRQHDSCSDVAEFARDTANGGALTQLASPDSCIQDSSAGGSECPETRTGPDSEDRGSPLRRTATTCMSPATDASPNSPEEHTR